MNTEIPHFVQLVQLVRRVPTGFRRLDTPIPHEHWVSGPRAAPMCPLRAELGVRAERDCHVLRAGGQESRGRAIDIWFVGQQPGLHRVAFHKELRIPSP